MKINIDKKVENEIKKYLTVKEDNMSLVELINIFLSEECNNISKKDIDKFNTIYKEESKSYFYAFLNKVDVDKNDEYFIHINNEYGLENFACLDENEYYDDPYYKNIKSLTIKEKDWLLTMLHYNPYQAFVYDEIKVETPYFKEIVPLGYFKNKFNYLAIIQDEKIWMSVIPHEINTMKKPIEKAYGDVLVIGLGLGYYSYMISLKDDVDKITIIEKDHKAIKLFKEKILPSFEYKNKIKIINDDAFEFLKNNSHEYDFAFVDIYHNVSDGLSLYLMSKYYENKYENTHFEYWIETSLLSMLRRMMLTVFEEQYLEHFTEKDYKVARNNDDKIINRIYFYTKDYQINNIEDFKKLLSEEYLKDMAKKLYLN